MQYFLYIILMIIPLPFASVPPVWRWLWVCLIAVAAISTIAIEKKSAIPRSHPYLLWPVTCGLAVVTWGAVQALAPAFFGTDFPGNSEQTLSTTLHFLSHILWFVLILRTLQSRRAASGLLLAVGIICCLYVLYGGVVFFSKLETVLWYEKSAYKGSLTSTFINRNNFATFCGLGLQCMIAYTLSLLRQSFHQHDTHRLILQSFAQIGMNKVTWAMIANIILLTGLLLTSSRAGVITSLACAALLIVWTLRSAGSDFSAIFTLKRFIYIGGILMLIGPFLSLSGDKFIERLENVSVLKDERLQVYAGTIDAIADRPLTGHGLGAFEQIFRGYRTPATLLQFNRAHNDYLELAMTAGIPATILFLLAFSYLFVVLARALRLPSQYSSYIALSLMAMTQIALHSAVDFPLQVPAISYTFTAILACGLSIAYLNKAKKQSDKPDEF